MDDETATDLISVLDAGALEVETKNTCICPGCLQRVAASRRQISIAARVVSALQLALELHSK